MFIVFSYLNFRNRTSGSLGLGFNSYILRPSLVRKSIFKGDNEAYTTRED